MPLDMIKCNIYDFNSLIIVTKVTLEYAYHVTVT